MYRILKKQVLAKEILLFEVEAPLVAKACKPGQFIILRIDEKGERIPLTIYDHNSDKGTISIIFQQVGKTTYQLGSLNSGDYLMDFVGPLGVPFEREVHLDEISKVICVGGGVGTAPLFPKARWLKEKGCKIISIIGSRTKELLILEEKMREVSEELYICTDDGSYGEHGFVTQVLKRLLDQNIRPDLIIAIGPLPMMKACAQTTKEFKIKTLVSLNAIMVDGTGMCGSCRVKIGKETKFTCVEGPTFDGHLVDFQELAARQNRFLEEENISLEIYRKERCGCQM
jgi:ferredoxin--NADP+ reductase